MTNNKSIQELLEDYQFLINYRNRLIDTKTFSQRVEAFFGGKISCNSCPAALKKAMNDYERVVLTMLYKENKSILVQPNKELLKNTRFINGMYDTLVTSSFDAFGELLESFIKDYKTNRKVMSQEEFKAAYDELIAFNRKRLNYFDTDEYKNYLISMAPKVEPLYPFDEKESKEFELLQPNQDELMQESGVSPLPKSSVDDVVIKPKRNKSKSKTTNNNGETETTNQQETNQG